MVDAPSPASFNFAVWRDDVLAISIMTAAAKAGPSISSIGTVVVTKFTRVDSETSAVENNSALTEKLVGFGANLRTN